MVESRDARTTRLPSSYEGYTGTLAPVPRTVASYVFCRSRGPKMLARPVAIGKTIFGDDHSTLMYALRRIELLVGSDVLHESLVRL